MAIDFEAEGLLQGTDGTERDARLRLLEELTGDGVSLDELRQAVEDDRLALLPLERVLEGEGRRYTVEEVAERAGVELDLLRRLQQAIGLPTPEPGERAFTEDDVESARRLNAFREAGIPEEGLLEISRVIGMAMGQIAATTRDVVGDAILQPGDTELDVGGRFAAAAKELIPTVGPTLQYAFALHLRELIRREAIGRVELATGRLPGAVTVTVAFADMVGFTRLGEGLPADQLGGVTGRLSELAAEVAQPPVRLVKLIGDAAMLVSPETDPVLDATLSLVEAAEKEGEGFPALRGGVAKGDGASAGRGLVRTTGQPRQPGDRGRASRKRPLCARGLPGRGRGLRVVERRLAAAEGDPPLGAAGARPPRVPGGCLTSPLRAPETLAGWFC